MSNLIDVHQQVNCVYYIKYYPEFKREFRSEKAALIFERLEYWSQRYSSGFWKFFEPCQHPLYRKGDSWQEEIGISRKVWTKAFAILGTHYKSKSTFLKQSDPFQGKLYASYYDRKTNRTYFFRNHDFVRKFLEKTWNKVKNIGQKIIQKKGRYRNSPYGCSFTRAYKDIFSNKEILSSPPTPSKPLAIPQASTQEKERDILKKGIEHITPEPCKTESILTEPKKGKESKESVASKHQKETSKKEQTLKKTSPVSSSPSPVVCLSGDTSSALKQSIPDSSPYPLPSPETSQEMVNLWNQAVEGEPGKAILTWWRERKLRKALKDSFNNDLHQWTAYCERIAANTFLMGGGTRGWKASLDWAIHPENIQKVREESYFTGHGQKKVTSNNPEREKPLSMDELEGTEQWKNFCLSLSSNLGVSTFRSWFMDVVPLDLEGFFPQLRCGSAFKAQWIKSRFGQRVESVLRKTFPEVREVEFVYETLHQNLINNSYP